MQTDPLTQSCISNHTHKTATQYTTSRHCDKIILVAELSNIPYNL